MGEKVEMLQCESMLELVLGLLASGNALWKAWLSVPPATLGWVRLEFDAIVAFFVLFLS